MKRKILGLKVWDKALENSTREQIIEESISICTEFPDVWGRGWSNFDWAIGNAVRDIAYPKSTRDIAMTWNADDVLTSEELDNIKTALGFKTDYTQTYK
jgi:hypothetical protein